VRIPQHVINLTQIHGYVYADDVGGHDLGDGCALFHGGSFSKT
jgi:hypothetical protein